MGVGPDGETIREDLKVLGMSVLLEFLVLPY